LVDGERDLVRVIEVRNRDELSRRAVYRGDSSVERRFACVFQVAWPVPAKLLFLPKIVLTAPHALRFVNDGMPSILTPQDNEGAILCGDGHWRREKPDFVEKRNHRGRVVQINAQEIQPHLPRIKLFSTNEFLGA
jgi:hypothetical protein